MKTILFAILGLIGVLTLTLVLNIYGLETKRYFKPKHAEIDRQVFEQTPSFIHGKAQYIARLRLQYESADTPEARASIKSLIFHEVSSIDRTLLPNDIQSFLNTL